MDQEERRRRLELNARYNQRITVAKIGRTAFTAKNYGHAVKNYNEYLNILANSKEVESIFVLAPSHFDEKTPVSELLLISHVYWDLSRMYETSPKFSEEYAKSISQFIKFSANQPFQVLNAEMVRKYIRKRKRGKNLPEELKKLDEIYSQIYSESRSCFVASYCFGQEHPVTNSLRQFKKRDLLEWPFGIVLTRLYYQHSPKLIQLFEKHHRTALLSRLLIIPALRSFAFLTQTSIFNRCSYCLKLLRNRGLNR